jgi:hypothetical protein
MTSTTPPDGSLAARHEVERLAREIVELKAAVERLERQNLTQITRVGQLQADIDAIRAAWAKFQPTRP